MKRREFIGRAFAAILLTGIVSPLIFATGWAAVGLVQFGGHNFSGTTEFVSAVWFFGAFIALAFAIVIGLCVEWPKSYWLLKRRSGGWWASLLISLLFAEVLLHSLPLIDIAARGAAQTSDLAGNLIFFTCAAAVGGACSATFWWWLVVWPGRRFALRMQRTGGRFAA